MEKKRLSYVEQIPRVDWEKTPASVQELVEGMGQQIESLEKQLAEVLTVQEQLLEKANRTSENSSDRHGAYNWVDIERRQLCWAHLRRDFIKISERPGISKELGTALVKNQEKLFELWHRVRDGTLDRCDFVELVKDIRLSIKSLLLEAADYEIGSKEQTPLAKTVRTCRQLLKVESAMWLFVTTPRVEPTNNAAERAIRPAVIWRRTSFGSQTQAGSDFVARMLTVVTTLKSQQRNVLEFLTSAVVAARIGKSAPSLLPEVATSCAQKDLLKAA